MNEPQIDTDLHGQQSHSYLNFRSVYIGVNLWLMI